MVTGRMERPGPGCDVTTQAGGCLYVCVGERGSQGSRGSVCGSPSVGTNREQQNVLRRQPSHRQLVTPAQGEVPLKARSRMPQILDLCTWGRPAREKQHSVSCDVGVLHACSPSGDSHTQGSGEGGPGLGEHGGRWPRGSCSRELGMSWPGRTGCSLR